MEQPQQTPLPEPSPLAAREFESRLKSVWSVLPVIGGICLVAGFATAVYNLHFDMYSTLSCVVGLLLFLTLFAKAELANLKYYMHVTLYSALVLGIAVVIYMFGMQYTHKFDLTSQKLYSLSDESTRYLKKLDERVEVAIMSPQAAPFDNIIALYKGATDKVVWSVVDPTKNPVDARKWGDNVRVGDVYVKAVSGGMKKVSVTEMGQSLGNAENILTNAIVEVTRKNKPKIYFLQGHGEISYEKPAPAPGSRDVPDLPSLGAFRDFLSKRAIDTAQLDLTRAGVVPPDASVIVEAGPTRDIFATEATALGDYLAKNGKLLVMLPALPLGHTVEPYTNLKSVVKRYGIVLPDQIILDVLGQQLNNTPQRPVVSNYDDSCPITANLAGRAGTMILPPCRPVQSGNIPEGYQAWALMKSSEKSFPQNLDVLLAGGQPQPPPESKWSPQPIAVAVGKSVPPAMPGSKAPPAPDSTRVVVYGCSELIQDSLLAESQTAIMLMLNTMNWLTLQEDMISVPPHEVQGTPIVLTAAELQLVMVFVVAVIPMLLFFGGVSYSLLRRRS